MEVGPEMSHVRFNRLKASRHQESIRTWRRPQTTGHRFEQRHHFVANVLISNGKDTVQGQATNISESGIFIATDAMIFNEAEELTITIVPFKGNKSYSTKGSIVRTGVWPSKFRGYGLQFK